MTLWTRETRLSSATSDLDSGSFTSPLLDLTGVSRTYPGTPPVHALRACHLQITPGEMVTIVGPSGSGKSTLLNLIGLLDRPTTGTYRLNGTDTTQLRESERSAVRGAWLGFVFQAFHLLPHRSAAENVALGLLYAGVPERIRLTRAHQMLDRVGLGHRAKTVPSKLSGGERQRVAIARALVHRPALLLCDEPTGNLDQATANRVLDLITEVHAGGQTVLVITHDPDVAERGQRVLHIRDGELTEQASHASRYVGGL
ncbi:MAG: ABC transporter ATP-binding protein [Nocardioidaceae bacterium]|nr:MAG: ABC transporter ATP-binding protein [Nocardioidaceae bacterium]